MTRTLTLNSVYLGYYSGDEDMATPAQIGKTTQFNPKQEEWTQYVERLEHFLVANDHTTPAQKKAILLTAIGPAACKILSSLVSPDMPGDKTYDELVAVMKTHYNPTPLEIVERFKFHTHSRLKDESVADYVAALRTITVYCNFGATLDTMLRDRIVCGDGDDHTQRVSWPKQRLPCSQL